jgi:hypothetical protein
VQSASKKLMPKGGPSLFLAMTFRAAAKIMSRSHPLLPFLPRSDAPMGAITAIS